VAQLAFSHFAGNQDRSVHLVGIARMAAQSSVLVEKRRVEYRNLITRRWLNRCQSDKVPFDWTINPYRGCEFGCKYCYARYTHDFLERHDPVAFETEIYAKEWNAAEFQEELRAVKAGQIIAIGTATDPYQPAERRFLSTRNVLEGLTTLRGVSICLTTKSNLAARDTRLFVELAKQNRVHVTITVTTTNQRLARLIEPFAPSPQVRLQGVAKLSEAGISVGVMASPILPMITDSGENLFGVAQAAKEAGTKQFGAYVLFLQPTAQRVFFPFVAEHFPEHLARYRRSFRDDAFLGAAYTERMRNLVKDIRQKVGMIAREMDKELPTSPPPVPADGQMLLF
jgi:DNA repair photolyase